MTVILANVESGRRVYIGASTDTKPTGVLTGSKFYEYNTDSTYITYDGTNWVIKTDNKALFKDIQTSKTLVAAGNYTANDVLSEDADNGEGTCWTFEDVARAVGGAGRIHSANIAMSKSGGITAITTVLALILFTTTPTSELDDNAANTGPIHADISTYIGTIIFPALSQYGGSPSARATGASANLPLDFVCESADADIYGILVTTADESSETASTVATITLYVEQL